jgi:hypothetical protein
MKGAGEPLAAAAAACAGIWGRGILIYPCEAVTAGSIAGHKVF